MNACAKDFKKSGIWMFVIRNYNVEFVQRVILTTTGSNGHRAKAEVEPLLIKEGW
jgi:hypothetical protein